jgi:glycosyltransferase involved in cell wall biosynthesis
MEVIVQANGAGDWRDKYQERHQQLLKQPGVVWRDRVGQKELWRELAKTNLWFHPTDFPETSCITSMEAQAAGALPVTNRLWALKDNVINGYRFDGIPQKSPRVKCEMIEAVVRHLRGTHPRLGHDKWDSGWFADPKMSYVKCPRNEMREAALLRFDWANVVGQWTKWLEEDLRG